ncbi:MAG: hypothetical protein E7282_10885 [Lachnospiraceae bacterium]|nr:hypothetical protein [Lachnospiraceae bacterium]
MNWLDKLERKFPRFGIPNITLYLVACNAIGFIISNISDIFAAYTSFDVYHILHGQIWRLVTWIFTPSSGNTLSMIIFLLCAIGWGRSLEMMQGTFRTTVFIVGGVVISDILAFVYYFISGFILQANGLGGSSSLGNASFGLSPYLTSYYIILTILMEMALIFPDGEVRLWFILPLRMRWIFWITLAELAYEIFYVARAVWGLRILYNNLVIVLLIGAYVAEIIFALLNLLIFYLASKNRLTHRQKQRRREFQQQFRQAEPRPGSGIARHKCAICGRTELTNPELDFRYCSKCKGGYEYCNEHLFTHQHR